MSVSLIHTDINCVAADVSYNVDVEMQVTLYGPSVQAVRDAVHAGDVDLPLPWMHGLHPHEVLDWRQTDFADMDVNARTSAPESPTANLPADEIQ